MEDLTRREDPAAGIVRIMTIHKSKGLGFDIVILPQIGRDTPFANATHLTHVVKKNRDGGIEGIVIKPPKEIYQEIPQFRELYREWRARQQFDGFCKLYVALTRAKRATYVILPYREDKGEETADSMWKVVRSSIRSLNRGTEDILPESGASCLYSRGLEGWYAEFPEIIHKRAEESALEWPTQKPLARERISPSGLSEEASPLRGEKHAGAGKAAALGSAVHAVFERITRWDDENKPEWALHPATEAERIVAECMEIPSIRGLFTSPETARIMKEQRIEAIDGNNWISGIIDRLIRIPGTTARAPLKPIECLCPHCVQNHRNTAGTHNAHHCFHLLKGNRSHPISLSFRTNPFPCIFPRFTPIPAHFQYGKGEPGKQAGIEMPCRTDRKRKNAK